ncbi:titin homolog [Lingula anatina]|uniref:Titin homolog n=1 Tax=Lingula anatina TaxID=7574 RepID=A0A1S3H0Q3_LINAN|nr:titin homolog [Lingula anatina]|eukprot:XP_013379573.1 titin homolog [Lingula anatina]
MSDAEKNSDESADAPADDTSREVKNEEEDEEKEKELDIELDENLNPITTLKELQSRLRSEHKNVEDGTLLEHYESNRVATLRDEIKNCSHELKKCNVYIMAAADSISATRDVMAEVVQTITSKLKQEFKPFEHGDHPMTKEEIYALEQATKAHDTFAEAAKDLQNLLVFTAEINEAACKAAAAAAAASTEAEAYGDTLENAQKTLEEEEEERLKKEEEERRIQEEEEAERKRQEEEEAERKRKEEEERKRLEEEEKKKKEADRKPGETDEEREQRRKDEEEKKKKEEEIKRKKEEEERKEREKRDPANWTPVICNIDSDGFERGIGCIVRSMGDEVTQDKLTSSKLDLLDPNTCMKLGENEELVGHVLTIAVAAEQEEQLEFEEPMCLAVPHCAPKNVNYRVVVLKVKNEDGIWSEVQTCRDVVFEDYKDIRFIEMSMKSFKSVTCAVVTRLKDDKEVINNRGGKVTSSVDSRIYLQFAKNAFRLSTPVRLQVQPMDQLTVNDMKSRHKGCEQLLSASSILYLSMTNNFNGAPTVSIPAPGGLSKKRARGRTAVSRDKGGPKLPARPSTTHGHQEKADEENEDVLHLLIQGKGNAWVRVPGVEFTPGRGDVVTFPLETQTSRKLERSMVGVKDEGGEILRLVAVQDLTSHYLISTSDHPMTKEEIHALEQATKAHDTFAEAAKDLQNLLVFTAEINEAACKAAAAAAAASTEAEAYGDTLESAQKTLEEEEEERLKKEEEERRIQEEEEAERKRQEEEEAERKRKEEEKRKRLEEEEKKKKEADRKPGETDEEREQRRKDEEEKKKKEEEIKRKKEEEERKEREKRDPANWTPVICNIDSDGFERGIGCIVRSMGDEVTQDKLASSKLDLLDPNTCMKLGENEELVGHVLTIAVAAEQEEQLEFEEPMCLAVPHCAPKNVNYRVVVLKVKNEDGIWSEVQTCRDVVFEDYKDIRFIEMSMKSFKSVTCAVVTRLKDDKEVINNRGGKVTSSVDSRIYLQFAKNAFRLSTPVRLQVQPMDQLTVNDMKSRHKGCEQLLSASSILYLSMTNNFSGAPTVSIPAPGGLSKKRARGRTAVSRDKGGPKLPARPSTTHGHQEKADEENEDVLHLLIQGKGNAWVRVPGVEFTPGRGDVVTFPLETQTSRILVLKTKSTAEAAHIAAIPNIVDTYLQERVVKFLFRQKEADPSMAVVDCVRADKCEKSSDYYKTEGYGYGPVPSKDIILHEGQEVKVTFRGNLQFEGDSHLKFVFNSNLDSARTQAVLVHKDFYAQKGFDSYMGHAQFWTDVTGDENHNEVMLCEMCVKIPKPPPQNPQPLNRVPLQMQAAGILTTETMQHVAKQIGEDWEALAAHLHLKKATIQQIKRENYDADSDKLAYGALQHWYKHANRGADKVKKLCEALENCSHSELAAELLEKEERYKLAQNRKVEEANLRKAYTSITHSNTVINEWKMLARELGVPESDISAIESDHGNSLKEQCYQSLLKWQEIKGHDATLRALIDVLRECQYKNVADQLQGRFNVQPLAEVEEE